MIKIKNNGSTRLINRDNPIIDLCFRRLNFMYNVDINFNGEITNREIAFIVLANACGKVLANKELYPIDIFNIAYRYLFEGCKSRCEYEYLVNFLIENPSSREELFK